MSDDTPRLAGAAPPAPPSLRLSEVVLPIPKDLPADHESRTIWIWQSARYLAQRAVQDAEALGILPDGAARKRYAVRKLRQGLDELRCRAVLVLPARLVALTFRALSAAAPWLVEQAFEHLARWAGGAA